MTENFFQRLRNHPEAKRVLLPGALLLILAIGGAAMIDPPGVEASRKPGSRTAAPTTAAGPDLGAAPAPLGGEARTTSPERPARGRPAVPQADTGFSPAKLVAGLVLVAVLFGGALVVAKGFMKRNRLAPDGRRVLKVIDAIPLGPKRQVYVLEAYGRKLVVGAAPEGLRLLSEFCEDEVSSAVAATEAPSFERALGPEPGLAELLGRAVASREESRA